MVKGIFLFLLIAQLHSLYATESSKDFLEHWETYRSERLSAATPGSRSPSTPDSTQASSPGESPYPSSIKRPCRAAVFEGGGVRGAFSAEVLRLLLEKIPSDRGETPPQWKVFDLFCGTSTGSLIALACAMPYHPMLTDEGEIKLTDGTPEFIKGPYSPENIVKLYERLSSQIFVPRSCRQTWCGNEGAGGCCGAVSCLIKSAWDITFGNCLGWSGFAIPGCRTFGSCSGYCGPRYDNKNFRSLLKNYFGDITFRELARPALVVATNIDGRKGQYLSSSNTPYMLVADAALASTAAQTYFPPVQVARDSRSPGELTAYSDGGISDNSPCLAAMVEIANANNGRLPDNFYLVSFGTGVKPSKSRFVAFENRGTILWARQIIKQGIEGTSGASLSRARFFSEGTFGLEKHIFEFQLSLREDSGEMDDPTKVEGLIQSATKLIEEEDYKESINSLKKILHRSDSSKVTDSLIFTSDNQLLVKGSIFIKGDIVITSDSSGLRVNVMERADEKVAAVTGAAAARIVSEGARAQDISSGFSMTNPLAAIRETTGAGASGDSK